jgi:hypothetical protein
MKYEVMLSVKMTFYLVIKKYLFIFNTSLIDVTSLMVWWSERLITSHKVSGSILGLAVGIFPCRGRSP